MARYTGTISAERSRDGQDRHGFFPNPRGLDHILGRLLLQRLPEVFLRRSRGVLIRGVAKVVVGRRPGRLDRPGVGRRLCRALRLLHGDHFDRRHLGLLALVASASHGHSFPWTLSIRALRRVTLSRPSRRCKDDMTTDKVFRWVGMPAATRANCLPADVPVARRGTGKPGTFTANIATRRSFPPNDRQSPDSVADLK